MKTLNCAGSICPLPIVQVAGAIQEIRDGEDIAVIATDPGFPADIEAWANRTNNQLLTLESNGPVWIAVIRKGQSVPQTRRLEL